MFTYLDIHRLGQSDCFSGRPKEPTKEEIMAAMKDKESKPFLNCMHLKPLRSFFASLVNLLAFWKVDGYEEKIESLVSEVAEHKEEIAKLRSTIQGMTK